MDLSKLTDEQLEIAEKIAKKAKAKGLNPDFVLPMVMAESGFNPKAESKKGAIGVMQLMPDTAKGLRVNPHDMDENIDGGLNLLKELISNKKIGNDPYRVLAGYNASTETRNKFYETGDLAVLPDETIYHMDKVSSFYGGALPKVQIGEGTDEPAKAETSAPGEGEGDGKTIPASTAAGSAENVIMGGIGAGTGAHIAGGIETGKRAIPLIQGLYNKFTGDTEYMNKPQSRASLQRYLNSQIAEDLRLPLKDLEKVAGAGKPVRTMSEVQAALANIKGSPSERVAKTTSIDPKTGQPRQIFTTTPGKAPIDLSAYKHTPTVMSRAADQAKQGADIVKGALPSVARVGVGALGGALAGSQLYDAFKEYDYDKKGLHMPTARNAAQFASGAGGALSMLPFGVTQGVGLALQAPELAYQGYEGLKNLNERRKSATREDTDRMLMNVDPMGNPMP
jgi:hypothetical protein